MMTMCLESFSFARCSCSLSLFWSAGGFAGKIGCNTTQGPLKGGFLFPSCPQSCRMPLSPELTENGCYPLDDHLLCKSCHICWRNESSC